jgi:RNA polymerase sigma-70 factor (ECF subfamily)
MSDNSLPSRRTHSNEPGMTALDTIMGEVEELSRDRGD